MIYIYNYLQMTAELGLFFNCSPVQLQYLHLKLELYYALKHVFGDLLTYLQNLGVTSNISINQWIQSNVVCHENVTFGREILQVLTDIFGSILCVQNQNI